MSEKIIAVLKENKKSNRVGLDADGSLNYLSAFLTPVVLVFPDFIKEVKRKIALVNMELCPVQLNYKTGLTQKLERHN